MLLYICDNCHSGYNFDVCKRCCKNIGMKQVETSVYRIELFTLLTVAKGDST